MAFDALKAAVEASARAQADALLRRVHEEAERVRREAESQGAAQLARALELREAALRRESERSIASARRAARERVLAAREELLERIFGEAVADFPEQVASDAYLASLPEQVERALGYVAGAAVIECPAELAPRIGALVKGRKGVRVKRDDSVPPGFRVRAADGHVVVDASLQALFALRRSQLAIEVLRRLEAQG